MTEQEVIENNTEILFQTLRQIVLDTNHIGTLNLYNVKLAIIENFLIPDIKELIHINDNCPYDINEIVIRLNKEASVYIEEEDVFDLLKEKLNIESYEDWLDIQRDGAVDIAMTLLRLEIVDKSSYNSQYHQGWRVYRDWAIISVTADRILGRTEYEESIR